MSQRLKKLPLFLCAELRRPWSHLTTATTLAGPLSFVFADDDEAMLMKRLSGSELARAVLKQQEAQRRAAEALQLAWKKRKVCDVLFIRQEVQ